MAVTYDFATGQTVDDGQPAPEVTLPVAVPTEVSRFQAKAVMSLASLSGGVLTIHETAPQTPLLGLAEAAVTVAGGLPEMAWAEALHFKRDSPSIAGIGAALGLTSDHLDTLFIAAAQIEA